MLSTVARMLSCRQALELSLLLGHLMGMRVGLENPFRGPVCDVQTEPYTRSPARSETSVPLLTKPFTPVQSHAAQGLPLSYITRGDCWAAPNQKMMLAIIIDSSIA